LISMEKVVDINDYENGTIDLKSACEALA